ACLVVRSLFPEQKVPSSKPISNEDSPCTVPVASQIVRSGLPLL
ncbi:hypothetical protein AVEN_215212-1, partial [Araneus ventricosus]